LKVKRIYDGETHFAKGPSVVRKAFQPRVNIMVRPLYLNNFPMTALYAEFKSEPKIGHFFHDGP
jgi:hypothetical protein